MLRYFSKFFQTLLVIAALSSPAVSEKVAVFPEAGHAPFLTVIRGAKDRLQMAAYKFTDPTLITALREAADRGVKIQLLAENENIYKRVDIADDKQDLEDPARLLKHENISVHRTSKRFNQSHYKMILADDQTAIVSTGNFCPDTFSNKFEHPYRDFALTTSDPKAIHEISRVFQADIADKRVVPEMGDVVWGPNYTRTQFLALICGAKTNLDVYQQDVQDEGLARELAGAARAGVKVRLLMNPFPFGGDTDRNVPNQTMMADAGVKIMLCDKTYKVMHAKVVIADGKKMYLGSCNFYTPSLDQTRELGILTTKPESIQTVLDTFEADWKKGKPFVPSAEKAKTEH